MGTLIELFISFMKIGALSIGGGYSMLPFIKDEVVTAHRWLTLEQLQDIITISQMTPGPIAVNSATYVGYKVGGVWGSAIATFAVAIVPFILILLIGAFFAKVYEKTTTKNIFKGVKPAVVGLIAAAAWSVTSESIINAGAIDIKAVIIFAVSLAVMYFKKIDPIYILLVSAVVGIIVY